MTVALTGAVELLDRSLAFTRVALAAVQDVPATAPTPCRGWPLSRLLAHIDDGLAAWTEAASGRVTTSPVTGTCRLDSIRHKACALLGWWVDHPDGAVGIGDRWLPADVLVGAAALEIAVHGWDLRTAAGRPDPLPPALARPLLEIARAHVPDTLPCLTAPSDTPVPLVPAAPDSAVLLGLCGRT